MPIADRERRMLMGSGSLTDRCLVLTKLFALQIGTISDSEQLVQTITRKLRYRKENRAMPL